MYLIDIKWLVRIRFLFGFNSLEDFLLYHQFIIICSFISFENIRELSTSFLRFKCGRAMLRSTRVTPRPHRKSTRNHACVVCRCVSEVTNLINTCKKINSSYLHFVEREYFLILISTKNQKYLAALVLNFRPKLVFM